MQRKDSRKKPLLESVETLRRRAQVAVHLPDLRPYVREDEQVFLAFAARLVETLAEPIESEEKWREFQNMFLRLVPNAPSGSAKTGVALPIALTDDADAFQAWVDVLMPV